MIDARRFVEKPSADYARTCLGMPSGTGGETYYSVFGEYVLTPEVFEVLARHVDAKAPLNSEIQLTDALDEVRERSGLYGFIPEGIMFDTGNPASYARTAAEFSKN